MRKIFTLLIICFASFKVSAQVAIGSEGGLLPLGAYPAYYNQFLKGGFKSGPDHASRDAYPVNMRETDHFIFYTFNDNSFWVLQGGTSNDKWVKLNIGGGTSGLAAGAVLPASPSEGETFFLTTDKRLYLYNGTAWIPLDNPLAEGKFFIGNSSGLAEAIDKNAIPLSGFAAAGADLQLGNGAANFKIVNLADPGADQDAATKKYVDTKSAGADNLGNHTAAQNVLLSAYTISNDGGAGEGLSFDASGNAYFGQDVTVNNNVLTPSDQRLKHKVETLSNVLESLEGLRGVRFEYIDQKKYAKGPKIGVIAQELRAVYPELVTMGNDGFYKVDYTQLTGMLIQAVKEQQKMINEMAERLRRLEDVSSGQQSQIEMILKKLKID